MIENVVRDYLISKGVESVNINSINDISLYRVNGTPSILNSEYDIEAINLQVIVRNVSYREAITLSSSISTLLRDSSGYTLNNMRIEYVEALSLPIPLQPLEDSVNRVSIYFKIYYVNLIGGNND